MRKNVLNILNGQETYDFFEKNALFKPDESYIPFNEAMCSGEAAEAIFSHEFIEKRCQSLQASTKEYDDKVLKYIKALENANLSKIALWFDSDMFCQINMLTLLGYLDQTKYKGEVIFNLFDERLTETSAIKIKEPKTISSFKINPDGYSKIYKTVLIDKTLPQNDYILISPLKNGIILYLSLQNENNEITQFILRRKDTDADTLVSKLLKTFPNYGLGDLQYYDIIKKLICF